MERLYTGSVKVAASRYVENLAVDRDENATFASVGAVVMSQFGDGKVALGHRLELLGFHGGQRVEIDVRLAFPIDFVGDKGAGGHENEIERRLHDFR